MTNSFPEFLAGGGEMGARIRTFNWAATSLGPIEGWPQSLRTCIRIMLTSRQPMWLGWGKELIKLYNDPYIAIAGGKHPWALGAPTSQVWQEIWEHIGPLLKRVTEQDEGTYSESQLLLMERNGYPEETYYTFSYTPIPGDDGRTAGVICANTDDTERIISDRQFRTLTRLGKALADCTTHEAVIDKTMEVLQENPHDFPFSLFYTLSGQQALLAKGPDQGTCLALQEIDLSLGNILPILLREAASSRKMQVMEQLPSEFSSLPAGAWKKMPGKGVILPVMPAGSAAPYGLLVIGLNPHRLPDEKYRSFLSLITDQVATSFAHVHAQEEERKRAAALEELDRAKTAFFSNISHEFRTPLTLLLGPVAEALEDPQTPASLHNGLELAHRNALRMQKLVNTLLEFSRIEAGRMEGRFTRVDIGRFTAELASVFRSAIEKAGLQLVIRTEPVQGEVYVDEEMWERIVLNLVSNAFKYSEQGHITIEVKEVHNQVQVSVSDSGVGIPADHLDKIFNRFYRVEHSAGRSQEGTGIGLSMVKELVKLHQGSIRVESELEVGSCFTVTIPTGKAHLSPDRIVEAPADYVLRNAKAFVEEAQQWVTAIIADDGTFLSEGGTAPAVNGTSLRHTVLLVDDNADMRAYLARLLREQYTVLTAVDGEDAFRQALQYHPDLILSDIMMPRLDGLGLLKKLRGYTQTRSIPVIFLSARAGEEARIDGLATGADDYLVKPFSSREVVAKVEALIKRSESRRKAEESAQKLELAVLQRTLELQRSNEDLQQFAHVASHDLKEPVRKIKTFVKRLQDEYNTTLPEKGQAYVDKVLRATDRMFSVIEGLLRYSGISAADHSFQRVDLNQVVSNIESDLEVLIQQKGGGIQSDELPVIEGIPILLHQLFYNIIQNAFKFSRKDTPPLVSIHTGHSSGADGQDYVRITIADNGIGFEEQYASMIFDTFTRLNPVKDYEGTGLGLALCKKIVERHKGSITGKSTPDKGAEFSIILPVRKAASPELIIP